MKALKTFVISAVMMAGWYAPAAVASGSADTLQLEYKLHGQTRRFRCVFDRGEGDGAVTLRWEIVRNLKLWQGSYRMEPAAVEAGNAMSYLMPEDGNHVTLPAGETFAFVSRQALASLKQTGRMTYDGFEYELKGDGGESPAGPLLHVADPLEGAEMWIVDDESLPLVWEMRGNPLEIDWKMKPVK